MASCVCKARMGRAGNERENGGTRMRIKRIEIEGERGEATITRTKHTVAIHIQPVGKPDLALNADARSEESMRYAAQRLQHELDGYLGTNGDIADYRRALDSLTD